MKLENMQLRYISATFFERWNSNNKERKNLIYKEEDAPKT